MRQMLLLGGPDSLSYIDDNSSTTAVTTTQIANSVTGGDTQTVVSSINQLSSSTNGLGYDETGDDGSLTYNEAWTGTDVSTDTQIGNDYNGTYTLYHNDSASTSMTENAGIEGDGSDYYNLTHVVTSSQNYTENGDNDSGSYTRTGSESSNTFNQQSNDSSADGTGYYDETFGQEDSLTVSGNYQTGTLTITQTGTRTHELMFSSNGFPSSSSGNGYSGDGVFVLENSNANQSEENRNDVGAVGTRPSNGPETAKPQKNPTKCVWRGRSKANRLLS